MTERFTRDAEVFLKPVTGINDIRLWMCDGDIEVSVNTSAANPVRKVGDAEALAMRRRGRRKMGYVPIGVFTLADQERIERGWTERGKDRPPVAQLGYRLYHHLMDNARFHSLFTQAQGSYRDLLFAGACVRLGSSKQTWYAEAIQAVIHYAEVRLLDLEARRRAGEATADPLLEAHLAYCRQAKLSKVTHLVQAYLNQQRMQDLARERRTAGCAVPSVARRTPGL